MTISSPIEALGGMLWIDLFAYVSMAMVGAFAVMLWVETILDKRQNKE